MICSSCRSIDHPYMQELADRLSATTPDGLEKILEGLSSRAKSIVQALSKENDALKQQLEQVQADLKYGITKAHLAATVKAHDVEESNKTKRADTVAWVQQESEEAALKAHTTLAVEEIRASGKILDTHAKAGHEARAAERMIEAGERAETKE